jgi:hypothetical protein
MTTILFLCSLAAFFAYETVEVWRIERDPVAIIPLLFWIVLTVWWAVALINHRRKLRALWPRELGPWKG